MRLFSFLSRFPTIYDAGGFLSGAIPRQMRLRAYIRTLKQHEATNKYQFDLGDLSCLIPRNIWIYWAQGFDHAPDIVKYCVDSWVRENPGWNINIVSEINESKFIDMHDVSDSLSKTKRANILRLRLLHRHGGVWSDGTCYCHRPLDSWLLYHMNAGFFMFSRPGPDRQISNWFIAAKEGNPVIHRMDELSTRYWAKAESDGYFYFAQHYLFAWLMRKDSEAHALWRVMPQISAVEAVLAQRSLARPSLRPLAVAAIARGLPVSKLNRKRPFDPGALDALFREAEDIARAWRGEAQLAAVNAAVSPPAPSM